MSISSEGLYGSATIVNSDLFNDVEDLKEQVTTLSTSYLQTTQEHREDISQNRLDISLNRQDISQNRLDISLNRLDISLNRQDISQNRFDIVKQKIYKRSSNYYSHRPGLANRMRHQKASALLRPFPKSHLHFAKPGVSVRVCAVPHGSCATANRSYRSVRDT